MIALKRIVHAIRVILNHAPSTGGPMWCWYMNKKVYIGHDEWYPVFTISPTPKYESDRYQHFNQEDEQYVEQEFFDRYLACMMEFNKVQSMLKDLDGTFDRY